MAEKFIDLKRKPQSAMISGPRKEPRGQMLYVSNIDLPLDEKDLKKEKEVAIKIVPREIRTTVINGEKRNSFDLEVVAMKF